MSLGVKSRSGLLSRGVLLAAAAATAIVGTGVTIWGAMGRIDTAMTDSGKPELTMAELISRTVDTVDVPSPEPTVTLPAPETTGSLPAPEAEKPLKPAVGPVSRLPMPRFVSIKPDRVNVRVGPTRDQTVAFIFQKSGLPVEIVAEFENWRRIRDSEGAEGWVMQSMLSGRRTALVAPWSKDATLPLYGGADTATEKVALLEPGVMATIKTCSTDWCRIHGQGFDGWIEQDKLWGAYPGEAIE